MNFHSPILRILGVAQSIAMAGTSATPALLFSIALFFTLVSSSAAQNQGCQSLALPAGTSRFQLCSDLSTQGASIHWTRNSDRSVNIGFFSPRITSQNLGWVAWGINLSGSRMVTTNALVAYTDSSGAGRNRTSLVSSYSTTLAESPLNFNVTDLSVRLDRTGALILAKLHLQNQNLNSMRQLWQTGPVSGNNLQIHAMDQENTQSVATWDLSSGTTTTTGGGVPRFARKNTHGVLNAVSWGILMPMGAMIARYLKVAKAADPLWFYLHVACQTSAYGVGVAGWATGLQLGSDSSGIRYNPHRNIGIALFCLGTLQLFALLLRPKKDHKFRLYWNIYHHSVGYTVIILSVINVYKGFDILDPRKKWKRAYTGVIIALAAVAVVLEAFTWGVVLRRRQAAARKAVHQGAANSL